jgi:uncharacterized protein (DUF924 family)
MTDDVRARALLDLWFGDATLDTAAARERNRTWFRATPAFDASLRSRFGDLPDRLRAGEFEHWRNQPRAALARILALDQIPRNVFRGRSAAYAFDGLAQAAALEAVARGFDRTLHPIEAVFVYLPFEHAEDEALQRRSVAAFGELRARSPTGVDDLFDGYLDYAQRHARVIAQFGRFPHRNATLGRTPTAAETAYLEGGGDRF